MIWASECLLLTNILSNTSINGDNNWQYALWLALPLSVSLSPSHYKLVNLSLIITCIYRELTFIIAFFCVTWYFSAHFNWYFCGRLSSFIVTGAAETCWMMMNDDDDDDDGWCYRDSRDKMDGHRARVFSVVYHPRQEHILLTGGWDDTVQYWDDRQRHSFRSSFFVHNCLLVQVTG